MKLLSRRFAAAIAAFGFAFGAGAALAGDPKAEKPDMKKVKEARQKFEELWPSGDAWDRKDAVEAIAAEEDPQAAKIFLEQILIADDPIKADWYIRAAAWKGLARALDGKAAKDAHALIEKAVKAGPKKTTPALRACLMRAIARSHDPKRLEWIKLGMDDPSDAVRRSAAWGLAAMGDDLQAVELLLSMWEKEKGAPTRLALECRRYLGGIAGEDKGDDPKAFKKWLDEKKAEERKKKNEDDAKKSGGTTVERDPNAPLPDVPEEHHHTVSKGLEKGVDYKTRGTGSIPLLVIPDSDFRPEYYEPWFKPLESTCKIFFIKLPATTDFDEKELKRYEKTKLFYYPVARLVECFDKIREEHKVDKFSLCAFGNDSLVAEQYVTKFGDHVSRMCLVGAVSGDPVYSNIIDKGQGKANARKDTELYHLFRYWQIFPDGHYDYEPKKDHEKDTLLRRYFTSHLADPLDPANEDLFELGYREITESVFPDFDIGNQKKLDVPVLVCHGRKAIWTDEQDGKRLSEFYPQGKLVYYEESGSWPFAEETGKWVADMKEWLTGQKAAPEGGPKKK